MTVETGCRLHNNCFTCPFPTCLQGQRIYADHEKRKELIKEQAQKGVPKLQIAEQFNVSLRTVDRDLAS